MPPPRLPTPRRREKCGPTTRVASRDGRWAIQDRGHPAMRAVAKRRRGRVRRLGMGRLVEQQAAARTAGLRPARRVRKPLSSTQQHPSHDGWTCVTSSPGFPGRFTFCSHRFRSILRERAPLLLATVAAVPSKAVAFDDELAAGRVADAQRTSVVAKSGDNALSGTMMRARRAAGANEDVADRLEHNRFFRGRMLARTRRGGTTL